MDKKKQNEGGKEDDWKNKNSVHSRHLIIVISHLRPNKKVECLAIYNKKHPRVYGLEYIDYKK